MKTILFIFLGGGFGSMARYGVYRLLTTSSGFPTGTFVANILSSFLLGYLIGSYRQDLLSDAHYALLAIGFCGAFSTFSTFSFENYELLIKGEYLTAFAYTTLSFLLGILAVYLGFLGAENG